MGAGQRPVRPSEARASETKKQAERLERGDPKRIVLEVTSDTVAAVKLRAAEKRCKNVKAYILDLLRADGVKVSEPDDA
jgi:hypothetical protein